MNRDTQDDDADDESGDGVGKLKPAQPVVLSKVGGADADKDSDRRPDVGAEMQGFRLKRLGVRLFGDGGELAGTRPIDGDGEQKHEHGPGAELNGKHVPVAIPVDALERLEDDPCGGGKHEEGFDKGGKAFHAAVAVAVVFVGRLVADAQAEQGHAAGEQVDAAMGSL